MSFFILVYLYGLELSVASIFGELVHDLIQGPTDEDHLRVWDYLDALKTKWWHRTVFGSLVSCCLFDTFYISILNFILYFK